MFIANVVMKRVDAAAKFSYQKAHMNTARAMIGKREIVGYGFNGQPNYLDRPDFPMPAIRWKEPTADIKVSGKLLIL